MSDEDAVYEMTIDQPGHPKGELLQIVGLGTFENGFTYTISKEEADFFRTHNSVQIPIVGALDNGHLGSDVELGPTLLQAAKSMYGVTVTTFDKDQERDPNSASSRRATTASSPDTSHLTPSDSLSEAETPKLNKGGTDAQPKTKDKGGASA